MFRKLTVIICLMSFVPSAVSAEGLIALVGQPVAATSEKATTLPLPTKLVVSANKPEPSIMPVSDLSANATNENAKEPKKESKSSFNWSNFAEVHLGDYRWVWWAVAVGALIAIHAGVKD